MRWTAFLPILGGYLVFIWILHRMISLFPPRLAKEIQWIYAVTFETFALLRVILTRPFWWHPKLRKPDGNLTGRPILLVHGYLTNCAVWMFHKQRLEKAGFGPVYTVDLGHPFHSIRRYAEKVKEKVDEIGAQTGREDLVLIGHSMGGLVSSLYATQLAPKGKVTDVITIGTPLAGTPVAKIAIGPSGREMERNSPLIQEIRAALAEHPEIRFYHIAAKCDQLVIPGLSALLGRDASREYVLDDLGHAGLLYSDRVSQKVCEWVGEASKE